MLTLALASNNILTTPQWPFWAATINAVNPSCTALSEDDQVNTHQQTSACRYVHRVRDTRAPCAQFYNWSLDSLHTKQDWLRFTTDCTGGPVQYWPPKPVRWFTITFLGKARARYALNIGMQSGVVAMLRKVCEKCAQNSKGEMTVSLLHVDRSLMQSCLLIVAVGCLLAIV